MLGSEAELVECDSSSRRAQRLGCIVLIIPRNVREGIFHLCRIFGNVKSSSVALYQRLDVCELMSTFISYSIHALFNSKVIGRWRCACWIVQFLTIVAE